MSAFVGKADISSPPPLITDEGRWSAIVKIALRLGKRGRLCRSKTKPRREAEA
jgi:hypothetical protein